MMRIDIAVVGLSVSCIYSLSKLTEVSKFDSAGKDPSACWVKTPGSTDRVFTLLATAVHVAHPVHNMLVGRDPYLDKRY